MNIKYFLLSSLIFLPAFLASQSFPDNFTNDMQKQFFSMNQEQREAIAAQYGIDLSSLDIKENNQLQPKVDQRFQNDVSSDNNPDQSNYPNQSLLSKDNFYDPYKQNQSLTEQNQPLTKDYFSNQNECFDMFGNQQDSNFQDICFDRLGRPIEITDKSLVEDKLTRFGLSIFNNKISTFSPFEDIPVGDDYRLGAGDELSIKLVGAENTLQNLTIGRNGTIFIPKIGEIALSGITFNDAASMIKSRIQQELIGVTAFVTIGKIKAMNIFIAGEVNSPGMYSISALSTITQSLYQAGGISDVGSLRNIKVLRNGEEISAFDAYDLLIYGNSGNDIRLRSGDVVLVPPHEGLIEVKGSVKRSHIFEVKAGDTFSDLLKWSGGFSDMAYPTAATLTRSNSIGLIQTITNIDLLLSETLKNEILPNDSIMIPESGMDQRRYISVEGAINRPGKFGWFEGMRISDILSKNRDYLDDFNNDTDFEIAIIERFNQKTKQYSALDFSPTDILNDLNSSSNIVLEEFDILYFLPKNLLERFLLLEPFRKKLSNDNTKGNKLELFTIDGDVKFPGTYPLPDKLTLEKAIKIAGGTGDTAFLDSIEVSRTSDVNGSLVSKIFEVSALEKYNEATNFIILPRDRINIRIDEELTFLKSFTLTGFVRYPGSYPLNSGETLASVIKRAGGLKDNAFPEGARLIRKSLIQTQTEQNKKLAASIRASYASSLLTSEAKVTSVEDVEQVANIIEAIEGEGRLVINLNAALAGNNKFNIYIEDGDNLIIPQATNIINIIGEIRNPNVVNFSESLGVDDYLNLAGGLTQRADEDNIYILRANGSIVSLKKSLFSLVLSKPIFLPGDTLVVPIKQNYQDPLPLWSQVTQIIYQSMVSIAAVKGL